ncbi:hypothetical protein A9E74_02146 [Methylophaga muralis]|uniref:Uncharacterized protein n=1 Tax=Methylophaga muralis TaxID=291169 RepID=A0A1E3GQ33_9GAMM|nr:hypothetical protein A9E74_02146 [Methylophaga muralis]
MLDIVMQQLLPNIGKILLIIALLMLAVAI